MYIATDHRHPLSEESREVQSPSQSARLQETLSFFVVGLNGYKIEKHRLYLTGGKEVGFQPLKIRCSEAQAFNAKIKEIIVGDVRIVPLGNIFV